MVDMILENYSKAVDSTLRLQQELLRNWTRPGSPSGTRVKELPLTEPFHSARRKWAEAVSDLLKRHQETLDEQYRAGIRAIEDACRIGEARDSEQFLRLSEELWRRNLEVLKTAVASGMHDVQSVVQKWSEAARLGAMGTKV